MRDIGGISQQEFVMSVENFRDSFTSYTVTYLHDSWKNSFIEKRNAVSKKAYKFNFSITDDLFDESLAQVSGKKV